MGLGVVSRGHNLLKKQLPSEYSRLRYIGDFFQNAVNLLKAFAYNLGGGLIYPQMPKT